MEVNMRNFSVKSLACHIKVRKKIIEQKTTEDWPYINFYLFAAQLVVAIFVDFLEHIGCWMRITNIEKFNFKDQCSAAGNHITSTTITIAQRWWNGQFSLFTWYSNRMLIKMNVDSNLMYDPLQEFTTLPDWKLNAKLTDAHVQKSLIPSFNHLTAANLEWEWLVSVQTAVCNM